MQQLLYTSPSILGLVLGKHYFFKMQMPVRLNRRVIKIIHLKFFTHLSLCTQVATSWKRQAFIFVPDEKTQCSVVYHLLTGVESILIVSMKCYVIQRTHKSTQTRKSHGRFVVEQSSSLFAIKED